MTRKHFEELAFTVAVMFGQISDLVVDKDRLLTALLDNLSNFCWRQNTRFNYSRFRARVLELVEQE